MQVRYFKQREKHKFHFFLNECCFETHFFDYKILSLDAYSSYR
jgi:hypothetical protein